MPPMPSRTRRSFWPPLIRPGAGVVRLVADESCDFTLVVGLRAAGHDVVAITETMSGADDEQVMALAAAERRLLLTEDKDFGQLCLLRQHATRASCWFATRCVLGRDSQPTSLHSSPNALNRSMAALSSYNPAGCGSPCRRNRQRRGRA